MFLDKELPKIRVDGIDKLKNKAVAVIAISMEKKAYNTERLFAIIKWSFEKGFKKVLLSIGDSLNKYNFMLDKDGKEVDEKIAHQKASDLYSGWEETNKELVNFFQEKGYPVEIMRWDAHLDIEGYQKNYARLNELYEKDKIFYDELNKGINRYFKKKENITDLEKERALSIGYLIEELAGEVALLNHLGEGAVLFSRDTTSAVKNWLADKKEEDGYLNFEKVKFMKLKIKGDSAQTLYSIREMSKS
ncbi:MAG: hypothetical protein JW812_00730 [Alphaproteobacteria bacterium]|nr:hypothetical protein [Alphaproteobacteria bacterium]MBN2780129.1 hypothetical protein [Alphaproteobacteria bacterium]